MTTTEDLNRALDIIEPLRLATPGTTQHGQLVTMALDLISDHRDQPDAILRLQISEWVR